MRGEIVGSGLQVRDKIGRKSPRYIIRGFDPLGMGVKIVRKSLDGKLLSSSGFRPGWSITNIAIVEKGEERENNWICIRMALKGLVAKLISNGSRCRVFSLEREREVSRERLPSLRHSPNPSRRNEQTP